VRCADPPSRPILSRETGPGPVVAGSAPAALILLEHHWAIPLRNAIERAGGFRISDGYISPLDLIDIGLMSAEEAKELHDLESAASER
jgi:hypothetical protein